MKYYRHPGGGYLWDCGNHWSKLQYHFCFSTQNQSLIPFCKGPTGVRGRQI